MSFKVGVDHAVTVVSNYLDVKPTGHSVLSAQKHPNITTSLFKYNSIKAWF